MLRTRGSASVDGRTCVLIIMIVFVLSDRSAGQPLPAKSKVALPAQALRQLDAVYLEKDSWTPAQVKIDSKLLLSSKKYLKKPMALGLPEMEASTRIDLDGQTEVDIVAEVTDRLLATIQALGGSIVSSFPEYKAIRARIPLAQLEALASEAAVRSIRPSEEPITNKIDTSQGDVAHRADIARSTSGITGTNVKVGVISNGVQQLSTLQASGDLPSVVTVLPNEFGFGSEGTAMMEIVFDLAPGAELLFATGNGGPARFANNIRALQTAGCKIIVDDLIYLDEPVFQDGVIAQAVESVSAAGTLYVSAAGNSGNKDKGSSGVWEGDFVAGPTIATTKGIGTSHDFGGSNLVQVAFDSPSQFTLQWSDPIGASNNDYDLFILSPDQSQILDSSINVQNGTQNPFEFIHSEQANHNDCWLMIVKASGSDRYLHLNANRGRLSINTAGQTWGHAAAASAMSVAAARVPTGAGGVFTGGAANPVDPISSDGPRRIFYTSDGTPITPGNFSSNGGTVRQKPDVTAAHGVATATFSSPFFGTSAAAPHAAAIAALVLSQSPALAPMQIRDILTCTAMDIEASGVDRNSGFGILNADAAVNGSHPIISMTEADNKASEPGSDRGRFKIIRSGDTCRPLIVSLAVTGTAVNGTDYRTLESTVTIPAGSSSAQIAVQPMDDTIPEPTETVIVTLLPSAIYDVGTPSVETVTILDDETPSVSLTSSTESVNESSTFGYDVTRVGSLAATLTVNVAILGTATNGADYTLTGIIRPILNRAAVSLPAEASTRSIPVTVLDDSMDEFDETVGLKVLPGTGYTIGTQAATVTILDDDPQPTLVLNGTSVVEGDSGTRSALYNATLSSASGKTVTANYATTGFVPPQSGMGVATGGVTCGSGVDYLIQSGALILSPGTSVGTIAVPVCGDHTIELNEVLPVSLSTPVANATVPSGRGIASGIILDNDTPFGSFDLTPANPTVARHERLDLSFSWTVPAPRNWHDLKWLQLRIRDGVDSILWLKFDEGSNSFSLFNDSSGQFGTGYPPGSHVHLQTPLARLQLAETGVVGSGTTGPSVTLNLSLSFKPPAAGHTFLVEVAASDDLGHQTEFREVGTVTVTGDHDVDHDDHEDDHGSDHDDDHSGGHQ